MLKLYAFGFFLLALMAVTIGWLVEDRAEMRVEIQQKDAQLEQAERARDAHKAFVQRAIQEAEAWQETVNELQGLEGRDAPLSDHMRAAVGRVWR